MKRAAAVFVAALAVVACGDDDDATEDEAVEPAVTAAAPASSAVAPPSPATAAAGATAAPTTTSAAAPAATVDPGVDPAVTFTEVVTLDGSAVDLAWRDGDDGLYVVEQPGRVTRIAGDSTSTVLDITDLTDANGEQGLLGLAFDPTGQRAYVNYTDSQGWTIISEHPVDADGVFGTGDLARLVLEIEQPYSNHNGGDLTFGPDGMLYIGMGDGGDRAATRSGGPPIRRRCSARCCASIQR